MLLSFSRRESVPLGKIGERLQVNAASVTNAVDRLEAGGLVTRRSNPDDGRGTLACLTEAGRRTAAEATRAMNQRVFTELGRAGADGAPRVRPAGGPPARRRGLPLTAGVTDSLTLK